MKPFSLRLTLRSLKDWTGRDDEWNKTRESRPGKPLFHDHKNGKVAYTSSGNRHLPFPIDVAHENLWFEDTICVDETINCLFGYRVT